MVWRAGGLPETFGTCQSSGGAARTTGFRIIGTVAGIKHELRDEFPETTRFVGKRRARRIGLLDHGGILLGEDLVRSGSPPVSTSSKTDRLFAGRGGDCVHVLVDRHDIGLDGLQGIAGFANEFHTAFDLGCGVSDKLLDFPWRPLR